MSGKFKFTKKWEQKAKRFLESWNNKRAYGVKCWYSYAGNIENGSDTLLIGLNPGGDASAIEHDRTHGYLEKPYAEEGFNSWIDEQWIGNGPSHQRAMRRVFETIYGQRWEEQLRRAACTNVFPVRTSSIDAIDGEGWAFANKWFGAILKQVDPKLIICNGNNNQNSAWAYLCREFGVAEIAREAIGAGGYVKLGAAEINGRDVKVLALPNLSRFARAKLYQAIGSVLGGDAKPAAEKISAPKTPRSVGLETTGRSKKSTIKTGGSGAMKVCNTSKEGFAMVLTCLLDGLGVKDVRSLRVRIMMEDTCLPYKGDGTFLREWESGSMVYLHACRGMLNREQKLLEKYGTWFEKAKATLDDKKDIGQMRKALKKHFSKCDDERFDQLLQHARKLLMTP